MGTEETIRRSEKKMADRNVNVRKGGKEKSVL